MSAGWGYAFPHFNLPTGGNLGHAPLSGSVGQIVRPMDQPTLLESATVPSRTAGDARNPVGRFSLSALSPSQLERACFTPQSAVTCQQTPRPASSGHSVAVGDAPASETGPSNVTEYSSPALERALSTLSILERRVTKQESRIQELEERLSQPPETLLSAARSTFTNTISCVDLLDTHNQLDPSPVLDAQRNEVIMNLIQLKSTPTPSELSPSPLPDCLAGFDEIFGRESHPGIQDSSAQEDLEATGTLLGGIGSPTQLTHHRRIDSRTHQDSNMLLGMGDSPRGNDISPLISLSSDSEKQASDSFLLPDPLPWNGTISWTTKSVFSDARSIAAARKSQAPGISPALFDDGLVYEPREGDANIYRTVAILGLPGNIDMKTFLKGIRGGDVYSAYLHNTSQLSGSHMGIVTFNFQVHAVAYTEFAAKNGVYFNGKRAKVVLFKTPTYPIPQIMERNIFEFGHTRCVTIRGEYDPERYTMVAKFMKDNIRMSFDLGDRMVENDTETEITIRFNSIRAAGAAMEKLERFPLLAECDMYFDRDPCSEPLPGSKEGN
ncbi:uncharacterized protein CIMG_09958 [Coccidioides immitis RS]|uniref:Uncharacterized protein n=3 Tax=Coccidioides immitis TaxID=5501 RepID=J3K0H7_COCIM|nr:uncharacterized protein CIMG_09958 [Coccidioides immitis RS]EAS27353.3 hypothetical protein CIMG_09958 [Coccidioides immitis RS]KMP09297.1 hypothetical protein CIRG_09467 [Coccidioides immitis RMSCC 2394]KMU78262.1 hypothetical protein CISG_06415 [Coccidioides immitis RMSCC 3703]